ncbi:MAG: hypothetical protein A3G03_02380 [Candidatus Taylorbacteria bacterium RIFCSPLOWO2_12_FULL_44_15c]|uniref:Homing endonuclease LAGLIDADG domain-containing protein n=1 Tax=Candidatus Taylorbacteria bacterium RIFCSPLOWO2_12_FULL_44_15c TaxID=1802333 RepID=A0A1G2P460_9BACT|nr:MAG: hypothetical protein A3G03_02380 [Candidatus Taylorbacteria bacterium RIFCSPLOWO2_12_FULL_44_15c]
MGNPVGSLEVPIVLHARKRIFLSLSSRQRDILIGSVLGDAYIAPWGKIRIEHSVKQSEYVYWKYAELKSLCYAGVPREITHVYCVCIVEKVIGQYFFSFGNSFDRGVCCCLPCRWQYGIWMMVAGQERKSLFPRRVLKAKA